MPSLGTVSGQAHVTGVRRKVSTTLDVAAEKILLETVTLFVDNFCYSSGLKNHIGPYRTSTDCLQVSATMAAPAGYS